jgi:hypothetical protein
MLVLSRGRRIRQDKLRGTAGIRLDNLRLPGDVFITPVEYVHI